LYNTDWFALQSLPDSWNSAGPTPDGLQNFFMAGPGLGTADINGDREALLDKIPDVIPLRAEGLELLTGRTVCAIVYDSDTSINYEKYAHDGNLKGANLGTIAFIVTDVRTLTGFSSSTLPEVDIKILDANEVCGDPLLLLADVPVPNSSSEPFDVIVGGQADYDNTLP